MKKFFVTAAALCMTFSLGAQTSTPAEEKPANPYQFTMIYDVPATSIKDQASSGTCWSFASCAFLESELLRMGKGDYDLSEMWIARHAYLEKAKKYARMHGKAEYSQGGATHDVMNMIRLYGIVPEEVYTGLQYGTDKHLHSEVEAVLKGYMKGVISNANGKLTPVWADGLNGILDAYFGEVPETFVYNGKEYTPQSFAEELGLNMDDYVSFTSFTHHPFYTQFAMEVPDNWAWGLSWNVPMDELMRIIDNALENGYTVDWASDVSEPGFQYSKGFAVIPSATSETMKDSEWAKWESLSPRSQSSMIAKATEPLDEVTVTQEMRQEAFDNYQTTDDHGMLITGMAKDQNGKIFYKVKNSWDVSNLYDGYFYASKPFVEYKTLNILVHKNAVPKDLRKKLGIK